MFSNLIFRNSRRSRKENGLFFSSLVISIVAFYMVLSISSQDVMIFLKKMESNAVDKLMLLLPVFFALTLVILFFLTYFANKYQFERRSHEFGMYLMLGMRKRKLFGMLLAEDLVSSVFALLIGLPVAIVLSEIVSLVTAKSVGMGIIGHKFSLSVSAIVWTLVGFLGIKLAAIMILSGKISRREIGELLSEQTEQPTKEKSNAVYVILAVFGILLLAGAYTSAMLKLAWSGPLPMALTLLAGLMGTILLFFGMRALIEFVVRKAKGGKKLHVFTFRQIQENVVKKSTSMAISSLLILAALCCFGAGIGIATTSNMTGEHAVDYTFAHDYTASEEDVLTLSAVESVLKANDADSLFLDVFEMNVGRIRSTDDLENAFNPSALLDGLQSMPASEARDNALNNLSYQTFPYLICEADYNHLLELCGREKMKLAENEASVYMSPDVNTTESIELVSELLTDRIETTLTGKSTFLTGEVQTLNFTADRSLTLSFALIVPEKVYFELTKGIEYPFINAVISSEKLQQANLMAAYMDVNARLDEMGLEYESFLQSMGRQLFYAVAASYITLYLAIVFLVVANTIIGVQFLMSQQKTGRRYKTLIRLGATYETLCQSAGKQIVWFMGLPVLVAAVSSLFGVRALFTGVLSYCTKGTWFELLLVSAAMIILLCIVELIYIRAVKRASDKYLLTLMQIQREE